MGYLNNPDATLHEAVDVGDFTPFLNGEATLVQMRTYYLDTTSHELRMRDGIVGTTTLVADAVFDLQIATALDENGDGVVADSEWAWRGSDSPTSASLRRGWCRPAR